MCPARVRISTFAFTSLGIASYLIKAQAKIAFVSAKLISSSDYLVIEVLHILADLVYESFHHSDYFVCVYH
ncbi:hypothetical protein SDC9_162961 [bioreactor metagenome]|uniref:Uncharacterized protein n=1 Tax=bioreactor metagenome TaxID=1076179 RepID=A0A645FMJ2_9ZZZZ